MNRWKKLATAGLLAVSSAVVVAPEALAWGIGVSAGCSGTMVDHSPLFDGSRTAGRAELYYSSAHGGTNCVLVKDLVSGRHQMQAFLAVRGAPDYSDDYGLFQDYAGGVFIYPAAGRCVSWGGSLSLGGRLYEYRSKFEHCT